MIQVLSIAHSETGGGIQTVFRINNNINNDNVKIIKAFQSDKKNIADIDLKTIGSYKNPLKKFFAYFFIPSNYSNIKKILKEQEIDIIHLHGGISLSLGILFAIKKFKRNAKVVLSSHGYGLVCPNYSCFNYNTNSPCYDCVKYGGETRIIKNKCDRRGYLYSFLRYIDFVLRKKITNNYSLYDSIVTPSEFLEKLLLNSRHNFKHVKVVSNPIDMKEKAITFSLKKEVITYVGRFSKEKNIDLLIEAFALAKKDNENLYLRILGDGKEKQNYINKVKELGLESSVYISEKFLNRDELGNLLLDSKVLVLPSVSPETFGLVLFEGLRYGLIPVSLNIGAQAENINKIGLGLLYAENEVDHLRRAILEVISNYSTLSMEIKEANRKIDDKFSIGAYQNNIIRVYYDAIDAK